MREKILSFIRGDFLNLDLYWLDSQIENNPYGTWLISVFEFVQTQIDSSDGKPVLVDHVYNMALANYMSYPHTLYYVKEVVYSPSTAFTYEEPFSGSLEYNIGIKLLYPIQTGYSDNYIALYYPFAETESMICVGDTTRERKKVDNFVPLYTPLYRIEEVFASTLCTHIRNGLLYQTIKNAIRHLTKAK